MAGLGILEFGILTFCAMFPITSAILVALYWVILRRRENAPPRRTRRESE